MMFNVICVWAVSSRDVFETKILPICLILLHLPSVHDFIHDNRGLTNIHRLWNRSTMSSDKTNLFPTLSEVADRTGKGESAGLEQEGDDRQMQEIESLCMRCHENVCHCRSFVHVADIRSWCKGQGTTRLLLTSIPYFKEIVVSSFRCDHCGHRDTEIQSAGEIQRKWLLLTAVTAWTNFRC